MRDPVLARTLLDLSLTATINDSLKLGKAVLSELGDVNQLHKHAVEQAGFAVLKAPDIPSVLVETAFITNAHEEKMLASASFQSNLAQQILEGIHGYFNSYRPKQQVVQTEHSLQYAGRNDADDGALRDTAPHATGPVGAPHGREPLVRVRGLLRDRPAAGRGRGALGRVSPASARGHGRRRAATRGRGRRPSRSSRPARRR